MHQVVQLQLGPDEKVEVEPGALVFMSPNIRVSTSFGEHGSLWLNAYDAILRLLSGEPLFINTFQNSSQMPGVLGLTAPNPLDRIVIMDLEKAGEYRCAKDAFLCALVRFM
jgi:uncharacterized protein (AIM24 family)